MEKSDNNKERTLEIEIDKLKSNNKILTETINNLNFIIDTLKESNKVLTNEILDIEHELDVKSQTLSEFLIKNGLSFEDIVEYETEKKIMDEKE